MFLKVWQVNILACRLFIHLKKSCLIRIRLSVDVSFLQDEEKTEEIGFFLFVVLLCLQELLLFVVLLLSQEVQKEEKETEEVRAGKQAPSEGLLKGEPEE